MDTETNVSELFTEGKLDISRDQLKKNISKVFRPDEELNQLPPKLTDTKRVLLISPPGSLEESYGRLSYAAGELPMLV